MYACMVNVIKGMVCMVWYVCVCTACVFCAVLRARYICIQIAAHDRSIGLNNLHGITNINVFMYA